MYAVVDIESTGGKFNQEGITEIAIYKFDGKEIVDQFSCLINPERAIQPFVAHLTGINNDMLRYAPTFPRVAKRIVEITEDCILVAHNAKFDYRMLRLEFGRLGYKFRRETICTLQLSRKLIPNLPSYSLGNLVKSLGIPITNQHRAFGDALATVRLFKLLLNKDSQKNIITKAAKTPYAVRSKDIMLSILEKLPTRMGVFYLHNGNGEVLYLSAAKNIRKEVNQIFTSSAPQYRKVQKEVSSASFELAGNICIARLKQNEEFRKLKPIYNNPIKYISFRYGLYLLKNDDGYYELSFEKRNKNKEALQLFSSRPQADLFLKRYLKNYDLNPHWIHGLAMQTPLQANPIKEVSSAKSYNKKIQHLRKDFQIEGRTMALIGQGRKPSEKSLLLLEDGLFKGMAYYNLNLQLNSLEMIYRLLAPMKHSNLAIHFIQEGLQKGLFKTKLLS